MVIDLRSRLEASETALARVEGVVRSREPPRAKSAARVCLSAQADGVAFSFTFKMPR